MSFRCLSGCFITGIFKVSFQKAKGGFPVSHRCLPLRVFLFSLTILLSIYSLFLGSGEAAASELIAKVRAERGGQVWVEVSNHSPSDLRVESVLIDFLDEQGGVLKNENLPCHSNCLVVAGSSLGFEVVDGPLGWHNVVVRELVSVDAQSAKKADSERIYRVKKTSKDEVSLSEPKNKPPGKGGKRVTVEPDFIETQTAELNLAVTVNYPAIILGGFYPALAHLLGNPGDKNPLHVTVMQLENRGEAPLTLIVKARIQGFSQWCKDTISIGAGEKKEVGLTPFFSEELSSLSETRPGAIDWEISDPAGKSLLTKTKRIVLAGRNDMVIADELLDYLAVFVTPNDPIISDVLAAARKLGYLKSFSGYQSQNEELVYEQVRAVFNTLSALGIHYRSATGSYLGKLGTLADDVEVQKIYFPRESLVAAGANCIDGTVFMASCLEKLELHPVIVLVPGHAFLGVSLNERDRDYFFVETSMLGYNAAGISRYEQATAFAGKTFSAYEKRGEVRIIDIARCRGKNIFPYPYYSKLVNNYFNVLQRLGLE